MKVTLVDCTGIGMPDPSRYAAEILVYAKNTRLTQGEDLRTKIAAMDDGEIANELTAILNSVRTSWEFIDYTFQIEGVTRAFTHQLVRTRYGVSFAQQAMRVADMGDFEALEPAAVNNPNYPELHHLWCSVMALIRTGYRGLREAGISAQDARGLLPTNVLTNILMKIDLRALADMAGKRDNLRAQDEYATVVREMARQVTTVMPWAQNFLYPERTATPALDLILKELLGDRSPVDVPHINAALKELDKVKATWG